MKNISLIMLLSVAVSNIHGASHDGEASSKLCDTLQEIIQARSLDTFKAQQPQIKNLHDGHIHELITSCSAYIKALEIIHEIRHNPDIRREITNMKETYSEGMAYLEAAQYLLPKHARSRAIAILHKIQDQKVNVALKSVSKEYTSLADIRRFNRKISHEYTCLRDISTLLQQELDARSIAHNP